MNKYIYIVGIIVSIGMSASCKKPYSPVVADNLTNILVVEGVINNGPDSTLFKISRAVKLSNGTTTNPETKAIVTIEDNQNTTYGLKEIVSGTYALPPVSLNATRNYRLRIKTTGGLEYLSDYEAVKNAPPIDSIGYNITDKGLSIYNNTHDATNNTRYYRWEYAETWRFHSLYYSNWVSNGKQIIPRAQQVYYCFANNLSSSIILGSTEKLSQDIVAQQSIVDIPSNSEKIDIRYSILVKQYALTQNAYAFWENMQKNTETLGNIFDQQPSAPKGNIHCVSNPDVPVIGYISVGTVQAKRIFIDRLQLPQSWAYFNPNNCDVRNFLYYDPTDKLNHVELDLIPASSLFAPLDSLKQPGGLATGFNGVAKFCADCTLRGTLKIPSFWK